MTARDKLQLSRRQFLAAGSAAGAGLIIGFRLPQRLARRLGEAGSTATEINAWVKIGTDDLVTLVVSESEMGQGVATSLPMILADELEAEWSKVRFELAVADSGKYGRQSTGGSTSIRTNYDNLRKAGAAAREMLVRAAAESWQVDAATCRAELGYVTHAPSGRRLSYGKLAERAAQVTPPENPALKDPRDFRYIGKPMKRLDAPAKVDGTAQFGIDVRVPGMLTAMVVHPPFGGKVKRFDATGAKSVEGVHAVIEIPTGVAVIADHYWAAKKGRDALTVEWDNAEWGALSTARISEMLKGAVGRGVAARNDGDAASTIARSARAVRAVYELPYLAHATMEPMNCTADVRADRCEVWVPTQAPTSSQQRAAEITGLAPEQVTVHTTFLGGGFGRRSQTDFVADAVYASKAIGRPVKVVYMREDDQDGGHYRPPAYNELAAALDADGWPIAWSHKIASPSILEAFRPLQDGIDRTSVEGAANLPYAIPNVEVTYAKIDVPITLWFWRSVGSSLNAYVTECFVDELARAGGKDPVAFRRRLLKDHPRHLRVLDVAADKAGWGSPLPAGHARGVAVHESFGSFVAEVAEVSIEDGTPRVHRVVCAVDCGQVVNPDTVVAQMESGIVYGLSAALYGEITIDKARAVQRNFDTYPVLRMREAPAIETHIVTSGDALGGIGEPGTPPIAAAVCNAIFALTGKPVRRLPIRKIV